MYSRSSFKSNYDTVIGVIIELRRRSHSYHQSGLPAAPCRDDVKQQEFIHSLSCSLIERNSRVKRVQNSTWLELFIAPNFGVFLGRTSPVINSSSASIKTFLSLWLQTGNELELIGFVMRQKVLGCFPTQIEVRRVRQNENFSSLEHYVG